MDHGAIEVSVYSCTPDSRHRLTTRTLYSEVSRHHGYRLPACISGNGSLARTQHTADRCIPKTKFLLHSTRTADKQSGGPFGAEFLQDCFYSSSYVAKVRHRLCGLDSRWRRDQRRRGGRFWIRIICERIVCEIDFSAQRTDWL